jgi:hypothetical protein
MLDSRPTVMLLDRSGRGRGSAALARCAGQVQLRSSSVVSRHAAPPALPPMSRSHCARGGLAADGPWGWENMGSRPLRLNFVQCCKVQPAAAAVGLAGHVYVRRHYRRTGEIRTLSLHCRCTPCRQLAKNTTYYGY